VNPASLAGWGRSGVYFQITPEWRSVSAPAGSDAEKIIRFPLLQAALNYRDRVTFGLSATTFLDRTWETSRSGFDHFGTDSVGYTETFHSDGAIEDVRLGAGVQVLPSLRLGIAGHLLSGENRLTINRTFSDSGFAPFAQNSRLSYSSTGASAGIDWRPVQALSVALSGRVGGTVRSYRNDTLLTTAKMPKRVGGSLVFGGIAGLALGVHAEWNGWSSLNGLAVSTIQAVNTWDYGVGAELRAPGIFGSGEFPLRLGFRHRGLPFQVSGENVTETTYSIGGGFPISRGRSRIDIGIERANRSAPIDASEHAWIFSAGFLVRP
jgi:hypothetical protein